MIAALFRVGVVKMRIQAVVRRVRFAADKPFGKRLVPLEHFGERLEPMQFAGQIAPKLLDIAGRLFPQRFVFGQRFDAGLGGKLRRRRKQPRLPA